VRVFTSILHGLDNSIKIKIELTLTFLMIVCCHGTQKIYVTQAYKSKFFQILCIIFFKNASSSRLIVLESLMFLEEHQQNC
jgi:hypothetical protein